MTSCNILIAGVGGQGNLVCGHALAEAAFIRGLRPVVGETFGASRRGGSVVTHLRITTGDVGPLVPFGSADLIIGLEPLETLRVAIRYANPKTICLFSMEPVHTLLSMSAMQQYPSTESIIDALTQLCSATHPIDTGTALTQIGTTKALNVFMLGGVSTLPVHGLEADDILEGIDITVGLSDTNRQAFDRGREVMTQ